jgi:hypothetical protein
VPSAAPTSGLPTVPSHFRAARSSHGPRRHRIPVLRTSTHVVTVAVAPLGVLRTPDQLPSGVHPGRRSVGGSTRGSCGPSDGRAYRGRAGEAPQMCPAPAGTGHTFCGAFLRLTPLSREKRWSFADYRRAHPHPTVWQYCTTAASKAMMSCRMCTRVTSKSAAGGSRRRRRPWPVSSLRPRGTARGGRGRGAAASRAATVATGRRARSTRCGRPT